MNALSWLRAGVILPVCLTLGSVAPLHAMQAAGANRIGALPFTITVPGTYVMTSNLATTDNTFGIKVDVPNVTIDMGGFSIIGANGAMNGVVSTEDCVTIRNGSISGMISRGISLGNFAVVDGVCLSDNGVGGLETLGFARVSNCTLKGNGFNSSAAAMACFDNSTITDCNVVPLSLNTGIDAGKLSGVQRCHVVGGVDGFHLGSGVRISDCTASEFSQVGFSAGRFSSIQNCVARGKLTGSSAGIQTVGHSIIKDCIVQGFVTVGVKSGDSGTVQNTIVRECNLAGIVADPGTRVEGCVVSNCNTNNDVLTGGIEASQGASVQQSTAKNNGNAGIVVTSGKVVVAENVTLSNSNMGIEASGDQSWLRANWSVANGANGIILGGDFCTLQDNIANANAKGLQVIGRNTLITGNRAANNSSADFIIPFGNPLGPINQNSGTIQGSVPWANFQTPF